MAYSRYSLLIICVFIICSCSETRQYEYENKYLSVYSLSELKKICSASNIIGKKVALLGGSYALIEEGEIVRNSWCDVLDIELHNYATSGYGFCTEPNSIQDEVLDAQGNYDCYILWASTNDLYNSYDVGNEYDYSEYDGFSINTTQCGGINRTIKTIRDSNPKAQIYFISSLPFFQQKEGYDLNPNHIGSIGEFVYGQELCCKIHKVPFLNMLEHDFFNYLNYTNYYQPDRIHLNKNGYERIALDILLFLSQN